MRARSRRSWLVLALATAALGVPALAAAGEPCSSTAWNAVRIAVLFPASDTGSKQRDGTRRACVAYEQGEPRVRIRLSEVRYTSEGDGVQQLGALVEGGKVDLVLGPADSGVLERAIQHVTMPEDQPVPVVSALVSARIGNDPDSWYFRTNVDVARRAQKIYDRVNRTGIQNIAVLYEDNAFGRRAEEAFRAELSASQNERYSPGRFTSLNGSRGELRRILDNRPGAVGIFASSHEIGPAISELLSMNDRWFGYSPLFFTVVDARDTVARLGEDGPDLAYVSLAPMGQAESEVFGLSYDTAQLALRVVDDVGPGNDKRRWAIDFRDRWVALMAGPPSTPAHYTRMRFDNFDNQATPRVLPSPPETAQVEGSGWWHAASVLAAGTIDAIGVGSFASSGKRRADVVSRRFGRAPRVHLLLVAAMALAVSLFDLNRRHRVGIFTMLRGSFLALILLNVAVASLLYLGLGVTGVVPWDGTLAAIGVGLGYAALLRSVVFESPTGQAFGLSRMWDQVVRGINHRIALSRFQSDQSLLNYLTFANTRTHLERVLRSFYAFIEDERERERKLAALEEAMARTRDTIELRRACAERILQEFPSWRTLQEQRLVPRDRSRNRIVDPELLVELATDHCIREGQFGIEHLETLVDQTLADRGDTGRMRGELQRELDRASSRRARFATYLRWLFVQHGFNLDSIPESDLVPPDWEIRLLEPERTQPTLIRRLVTFAWPPRRRQRRRKRVRGNAMVSTPAGVAGEPSQAPANLRDVSEGGAAIVVLDAAADHLPRTGDFDVQVEDGMLEGFTARARLAHRRARGETVRIGMEWVDLSSENRARLLQAGLAGRPSPGSRRRWGGQASP